MLRLEDTEITLSAKNEIARKVQNLNTQIGTIEICAYLILQEGDNEHVDKIRAALNKVRAISSQLLGVY